ncbi:hypothetical protein E0Z10_g3326 [Xylaria hypoxylon]|uniref:Uncharacterized protein n=1 Tax=Xylaria hypoxylon TaxID=37992 RepID=A0A4Z0YNI2_9PEZI|nr:hypothetical protein E0Z10_g3326 [Xylaria hypoxylon]
MQLTMAYSNEITVAFPPSLKSTAGGGGGGALRTDMAKQSLKKQQRPHPKSQPFDPEDLRRRLHVVIAERESQNEKRQRQRVDALPAKWAQVERDRDTQHLYIDRLATTNAVWMVPEITAPARRSGTMPKSKPQSSLQDKLRRSSAEICSTAAADANECPKYRHVPEQAAAQFSRTTTSGGMQGSDKSVVHSLSRAALRFYVEGTSSADRSAIESSITPGKQRKILQRARSQQDRQHTRNQFQDYKIAGEEAVARRRASKCGPVTGERTIAEEKGDVSTLADLHLHAYRTQSGGSDSKELHSSEETLIDTATANEHRIDWSQSDEMMPHEKRGVKLLRKTTSILTLKGKLGHLRRDSKENNNMLRIVTIQEDCDDKALAEADEGSTPMSPNSGSSGRSPRLGFWGRLKRH